MPVYGSTIDLQAKRSRNFECTGIDFRIICNEWKTDNALFWESQQGYSWNAKHTQPQSKSDSSHENTIGETVAKLEFSPRKYILILQTATLSRQMAFDMIYQRNILRRKHFWSKTSTNPSFAHRSEWQNENICTRHIAKSRVRYCHYWILFIRGNRSYKTNRQILCLHSYLPNINFLLNSAYSISYHQQ